MANANLTAARLRELLSYDPDTGVFTWTSSRNSNRAPEGMIAGWIENRKNPGRPRRNIEVDQRNYKAHRLAWLYVHGKWPVGVIDHINGDATDNRIANLRDVTQAINLQNRRSAQKRSRSGMLGAHWIERDKKWASHIRANGKTLRLGVFTTAEDAHAAYLVAKRRLHEGCTI